MVMNASSAICRRTRERSFPGPVAAEWKWILVLLVMVVSGCDRPVAGRQVLTCKEYDTLPIDDLLRSRAAYLSDGGQLQLTREDSEQVAMFENATLESEQERLILADLFDRLDKARSYAEFVKICPTMIRANRAFLPKSKYIEPVLQNHCAEAAFHAGQYLLAKEFLDSSESAVSSGLIFGAMFDAHAWIDRVRMRAEISSVLRRDREVLQLLLPAMGGWGNTQALRLAIRRMYSPEGVVQEFDRAIDSLRIVDHEDAPPSIRLSADTAFEVMGKRRKIGWTRLFGVEMLVLPGGEEPFFGFGREAYENAITETTLYKEMYCLPPLTQRGRMAIQTRRVRG